MYFWYENCKCGFGKISGDSLANWMTKLGVRAWYSYAAIVCVLYITSCIFDVLGCLCSRSVTVFLQFFSTEQCNQWVVCNMNLFRE